MNFLAPDVRCVDPFERLSIFEVLGVNQRSLGVIREVGVVAAVATGDLTPADTGKLIEDLEWFGDRLPRPRCHGSRRSVSLKENISPGAKPGPEPSGAARYRVRGRNDKVDSLR